MTYVYKFLHVAFIKVHHFPTVVTYATLCVNTN